MPGPKTAIRAARRGSNLPSKPQVRQKAPEEPTQLELVPEPAEPEETAPEPVQAPRAPVSEGGLVVTVKSCKLKETSDKTAKKWGGPVYRSCTGVGSDNRMYWWGINIEETELEKGSVLLIQGTPGRPFGKEDNPLYPINKITHIGPFVEKAKPTEAKVSSSMDDELVQSVAELSEKYGLPNLLRALAEVSN